jgi:hypothetical protein
LSKLVVHRAVEAFDVGVLLRAAFLDEDLPDVLNLEQRPEAVGDELAAVV